MTELIRLTINSENQLRKSNAKFGDYLVKIVNMWNPIIVPNNNHDESFIYDKAPKDANAFLRGSRYNINFNYEFKQENNIASHLHELKETDTFSKSYIPVTYFKIK